MTNNLEIENKYLVEFPKSWAGLEKLFNDLVDVRRITQTYLKPENDEPSARVRKTIKGLSGDTSTIYEYNKKKKIEAGVHDEYEKEISKDKYEEFLKKPHPGKFTVEKTRFVFKYQDQLFELDVFKGPLKGLAILEIELKDKDQKVNLPPFLEVINEVTKDASYNNFSLATKR